MWANRHSKLFYSARVLHDVPFESAAMGSLRKRQIMPSFSETEMPINLMSPDDAAPAPWSVSLNARNFMLKRSFDIVMSLVIITMFLPVLLLLFLAVKKDGGPAFFQHRRIGIKSQPFFCLKYRTMSVTAERELASHLAANPEAALEWATQRKLTRDPRITRLGSVLRSTSLDELPQLINVLRGEMSLIGPRPVVHEELEVHYCRAGRQAYAAMRPGITGLWQVSGRSGTSYAERVRLDIAYVETWSLRLDLLILLRTIPAVLARKGAV